MFSNGGIQDKTSNIEPKGGINKDSGLLVFSPHAHLHLEAARLAILHTEHFFDEIRSTIGDVEYAKFLQLQKPKAGFRNKFNQKIQICSGSQLKYSSTMFVLLFIHMLFSIRSNN